jgi:polyferredoxin
VSDAVFNRYPRPEFESGYTLPQVQVPQPRPDWWLVADTALLAVALGLSLLAVFRWKSRRAQALIGAGSLAYFGFIRKGCICPVGSIQNVSQALTDPAFALPILALLFFLLPVGVALWKGRAFCGSVCPFGALQELVHIHTVRVPRVLDKVLRLLPSVYAATAALAAATGIGYLICRFDPFVGIFRLGAPLVPALFAAAVLSAGLVVYRPYCRYVCPYGWVLGRMSLLAKNPLKIGGEKCKQCGSCARACLCDAVETPLEGRRPSTVPAAARRPDSRPRKPASGPAWSWRTALAALGYMAGGLAAGYAVGPLFAGWLPAAAQKTAAAVKNGALAWGLFLGAVFFAAHQASVVRSSRPRQDGYRIAPERCVSCGRCLAACPLEQKKSREESGEA